MALITCRVCEGQVSTDADACPHCGTPSYRAFSLNRILVSVIVVGSFIYALLWAADVGLFGKLIDLLR